MDTGRLQNPQNQQVEDLLASFGMVNLISYFRQRILFFHMKMWWQVQLVRFLCSRCDYVLGSDLRLFETVGIRDLSNYESNHFALIERLLQILTFCHGGYLRGLHAFPLILPPTGSLNLVDTKFQDLESL